jgi:hypothetical protein
VNNLLTIFTHTHTVSDVWRQQQKFAISSNWRHREGGKWYPQGAVAGWQLAFPVSQNHTCTQMFAPWLLAVRTERIFSGAQGHSFFIVPSGPSSFIVPSGPSSFIVPSGPSSFTVPSVSTWQPWCDTNIQLRVDTSTHAHDKHMRVSRERFSHRAPCLHKANSFFPRKYT